MKDAYSVGEQRKVFQMTESALPTINLLLNAGGNQVE